MRGGGRLFCARRTGSRRATASQVIAVSENRAKTLKRQADRPDQKRRVRLLRGLGLAGVVCAGVLLAGCGDDGSVNVGADPDGQADSVTLNVSVAGYGSGRVVSELAGLDCSETCTARFERGSEVQLTAEPDAGSLFAGWEEDCSGQEACGVTLDGTRTVAARFNPKPPSGDWYAGDGHVHNDHSSDGSFLRQAFDDHGPGTTDIEDQIGFGFNQGLDWMPLTDHRTYVQHWDPQWTSEELLLIAGEEANGRPHCTVFGAIDTAVQGAEPEGGPGFRNLQQSIWDVRAQGAIWNQAHPDRSTYEVETDTPEPNNRASQVGVALAEVWNKGENPEGEIDYAENRWRKGFRFGVIGASDNHDKILWAISGPGLPRTRVFAPDGSERGILTGLAAARTVVSAGESGPFPTLEADVEDDGVFEGIVGSELLAEPGQSITLRVGVERAAGERVLVYGAPGRDDAGQNPVDPVLEFEPSESSVTRTFTVTAPDSGHGWWYVMVRGPGLPSGLGAPAGLSDQLRAITSPIFVSVTGEPAAPQPEAAVPADAGAPDGAERVFGGVDGFAGFGDVAVTGSATHWVGERHEETATRIAYRRRNSAGALTAPVVISDDSPAARFPRVAARGNDIWVVWQDERSGQMPRRPTIHLRHSPDGGASWQPSRALSDGTGRAMHPAIALTPAGQPVVVWQDNSDDNNEPGDDVFDIHALVVGRDAAPVNLSGAGKSPRAANGLDSRSAVLPTSLYPDVAVREDGLIAVSWHDNRLDPDPLWTGQVTGEGTTPDDWEIFVATRPPDGEWNGHVNASASPELADWHSAVGFAGNGDLVVAWDAKTNGDAAGRDLYIRSTRSGDGGASFAPAVEVTAETDPGMARRPALGGDGNGGLVLTWSDSRSDDWRWRVFAAPVTADGFGARSMVTGPGNATFQRIDDGELAFTGDRLLERVQRDDRFGVFSLALP